MTELRYLRLERASPARIQLDSMQGMSKGPLHWARPARRPQETSHDLYGLGSPVTPGSRPKTRSSAAREAVAAEAESRDRAKHDGAVDTTYTSKPPEGGCHDTGGLDCEARPACQITARRHHVAFS